MYNSTYISHLRNKLYHKQHHQFWSSLTVSWTSLDDGWLKIRKQAHTDSKMYSMWRRKRGPTWVPYFPEKTEQENIKQTVGKTPTKTTKVAGFTAECAYFFAASSGSIGRSVAPQELQPNSHSHSFCSRRLKFWHGGRVCCQWEWPSKKMSGEVITAEEVIFSILPFWLKR